MTLDEALAEACSRVGIIPPKRSVPMRQWVATDTLSGKNGKGDGRIICDDDRATAINWQTGDKATVWLKSERTAEDRRRYRVDMQRAARRRRQRAEEAARIASSIVNAASGAEHPYTARKGFPAELPLVLAASEVRRLAGRRDVFNQFRPAEYLAPDGDVTVIVVPARFGSEIVSVQIIWPDGTKKFLAGGAMDGTSHRIATGADTWLCEGYATALSLRAALRALNRRDTVLVCFSAGNITKVARAVNGRCFIVADHDRPPASNPDQFGGLGAGEFYARSAARPYLIPEEPGLDLNDVHQQRGIFAVQHLVLDLIRRSRS